MSDCVEIHQLFIRGGRYGGGGRDSVAGVATCCGLDGPGVRIPVGWDSPSRLERSPDPPSFLYSGYRVFSGVEVPEHGADDLPPSVRLWISACLGMSLSDEVLPLLRDKVKQTRQSLYVTLRRVREPLLLWKSSKYYIFWVFVCSLSCPACTAHAPYCIVICEHKICVLIFSTNFFSETFLILSGIEGVIIKNV